MNALKRQAVSSKNRLVKQWLVFAEEDLVWAESSLKAGIWRGVCFACQQSFEKYLKAYLTAYNIDFPKTHDLNELPRSRAARYRFTKVLVTLYCDRAANLRP